MGQFTKGFSMTREERAERSKLLYEEYYDNADGQISYEALAHKYGCATSTIFRRIQTHRALLAAGKE